jgi:hypothetical protein
MKPTQIKALQGRAKNLDARILSPQRVGDPFVAIVSSGSASTLNRVVTIRFSQSGDIHARCTCRWAQHGGMACSHVIAALTKLAERKGRKLSFWLTPEDAARQKQRVFELRGDYLDRIYVTSRTLNMNHAAEQPAKQAAN